MGSCLHICLLCKFGTCIHTLAHKHRFTRAPIKHYNLCQSDVMFINVDGVRVLMGGEERMGEGRGGEERQISTSEMSGLRGDGWR